MPHPPPKKPFEPCGVIPAVLLPFDAAHDIDESAFRRHMVDVSLAHAAMEGRRTTGSTVLLP